MSGASEDFHRCCYLAATGLFADLLLFLNYSTAVNWRYFLTGLPAIAPSVRRLSDSHFEPALPQRPALLSLPAWWRCWRWPSCSVS